MNNESEINSDNCITCKSLAFGDDCSPLFVLYIFFLFSFVCFFFATHTLPNKSQDQVQLQHHLHQIITLMQMV